VTGEVDRDKAVLVLKEVFDKCSDLSPSAITLMPTSSIRQEGYQIHLAINLSTDEKAILEDLLSKHGLKIRVKENQLAIY
jgi:hypothetical protein